jgi:hypothetical protein
MEGLLLISVRERYDSSSLESVPQSRSWLLN